MKSAVVSEKREGEKRVGENEKGRGVEKEKVYAPRHQINTHSTPRNCPSLQSKESKMQKWYREKERARKRLTDTETSERER